MGRGGSEGRFLVGVGGGFLGGASGGFVVVDMCTVAVFAATIVQLFVVGFHLC